MDSMESWVQDTFAPVVLTCATSEAERIAQKNNLSIADLLNGFSRLEDADTPLRSVTHPIHLARFNFRFVATSQFHSLGVNEATEQLNASVKRYPPRHDAASAVQLDVPRVTSVDDVATYLRVVGADADAEGSNDPMPWYSSFKHTLMDSFRCEEYSQLSHPVAMLVVVSSTDPNPRHSFEELSSTTMLPLPFQQGLYDAALVPKFYVVVHDVLETEGTSIDPDAILRSMSITPSNGAVLRINSLSVEEACVPSQFASIWTENPYVRPPLFPNEVETFAQVTDGVGTLLSRDDVAQIKAFVRDFGLRFLLSSLEGRIFQLNEVVSAMKKGVKNVFKSWLRKPKDLRPSTNAASGGVTYRFDSIESQTRLLADTAFLVRDYELALQMYRLARDDYKSDKSVFHCGNVNEMIAICLLLTKGSPMQMTNALDSANAIYAKTTTPLTQRLAIRTAVIAGEIYHALSKSGLFTDYMDNASAALIRGSTMEQGVCAAVLMERAALCDLRARLPKFRKYGFRMVMAGHVYDSLGHEQHSARCYSLARAIYDCSGWFLVEDHINFMLAQQANKLDDRMASINLFLKLIGTGRNSASQQEAMLYDFGLMVKDFLATEHTDTSRSSFSRGGPILVQDAGGINSATKLLVRDLCMPELDDKSTVVFASTNAFGIDRSIDGDHSRTETWQELGKVIDKQNKLHRYVLSASSDEPRSWFVPSHLYAGYRNKKNATISKPENYVVGEQIYVEFVMKNALSCAVDVEDIHLFGKFETAGEQKETFDVPESREAGVQRIAIDSVNLQLLPCSEERVRLAVCPKIRGKLSLTGVRWSICGGDVQGEHAFDIPGPLLQDTRAHREARARAPNMSLVANVVEAMPWLGVKVEDVPAQAFVGELIKLNVSLVNFGTAALADLQVCCSDLLLCASGTGSAEELCGYIGANGHVVDLSHINLAPGKSRQVAIWARGSVPGRRHAALLFNYKSAPSEDQMSSSLSRTVKVKLDLELQPCVDVSYQVEPSFGACGEYIIGITVSNQRPDHQEMSHPLDGMVRLEELLCVSKLWTVERLARPSSAHATDVRDSLHLGFFEASTSYFRVIRRPDPSSTESELCRLSLHSEPSGADFSANLPIEQFLCLENAGDLVRANGVGGGDGSGNDGKRGGGFRTIQSVRRENKALKNATGDDGTDQKPHQEPQPTSSDALLSHLDTDGHLVLVWSTDCSSMYSDNVAGVAPRRAIGQANLTSVKIRPPSNESSCPLTVTLSFNNSVELRSSTYPGSSSGLNIAELDIMMQVCNDSVPSSAPLKVTVEMLHPEEAQASLPTSSPLTKLHSVSHSGASPPRGAPPRFFWTGITKKTVAHFLPNSQVMINLKACFVAPGVYNLNRFRFIVQTVTPNQPANVFMLPSEYLVYVKNPHQAPETVLLSEARQAVDEQLIPVL